MDNPPVDAVSSLVAPTIAAAGLFCEGVAVAGQGAGRKVTITVDLPEDQLGGVGMDTIAELSRDLSELLDASDVIPGSYRLEVTTPGVHRPLTEARHFKRARGRLVTVETDEGRAVGRVRGVRDGDVVLAAADGDHRIPLTSIRTGRIEVEFSAPPADFVVDTDDGGRTQRTKGA